MPSIDGDSNSVPEEEVANAIDEGINEVERNRDIIVGKVSDELARRGHGPLTLGQRARLGAMIDRVVRMARDGRVTFDFEKLGRRGHGYFDSDTAGSIATRADGGRVALNEDSNRTDLAETVQHELVHAAITAWAVAESPILHKSLAPIAAV